MLREKQQKESLNKKSTMSKQIQWTICIIECVMDNKWRCGKFQEISQNMTQKDKIANMSKEEIYGVSNWLMGILEA